MAEQKPQPEEVSYAENIREFIQRQRERSEQVYRRVREAVLRR